MQVPQFVDEGLGSSTHLAVSERTGLVALIDPLRDVDRYLAAAAAGARISHIFETHTHDDFLTGSRELAARPAMARSVLERREHLDPRLIESGWPAWQAAGYPFAAGVGAP